MELLTGLAPILALVIFAVYLLSRSKHTKPDGSKNTERHASNIDD